MNSGDAGGAKEAARQGTEARGKRSGEWRSLEGKRTSSDDPWKEVKPNEFLPIRPIYFPVSFALPGGRGGRCRREVRGRFERDGNARGRIGVADD